MRSCFGTSACSMAVTVALLCQAPVALAGPPPQSEAPAPADEVAAPSVEPPAVEPPPSVEPPAVEPQTSEPAPTSEPLPAPTLEAPEASALSLPPAASRPTPGKRRANKAEIGFGIAATFLGAGSALLVTGAGIGIAMPIRANQFHRELIETQDRLVYCGSGLHPEQCEGTDLDALKLRASAAVRNMYKADGLDPQVGLSLAAAGFVLLLVGVGVFAGTTRARFDEKRFSFAPTWNTRGGGVMFEGRF